MRDELHRVLDEERDAEGLPADLRREAEAWWSLFRDMRSRGPAGAPPGLSDRVLAAVGGERPRAGWRRIVDWWTEPRTVRVSPLAGLAAAATLLVAVLLLPSPRTGTEAGTDARAEAESAPVAELRRTTGDVAAEPAAPGAPVAVPAVYVQFLFRAPRARSVALAGDFSDWRPDIALQDPDGDGVWTARVPLTPGVHEYMFVVDGEEWVTDPFAERYADDGFGNRNAVVAIARPSRGL